MKAEYVNAFYKATQEVFKLMLDVVPEKKNLSVLEDLASSKDASVLLGVTGDLKGSVLFSMSKDTALEMIRIMSGIQLESLDTFASSALGEVANIIGGNAATILSQNECICDIVPPQIFVGSYRSYSTATRQTLLLSLDTDIGPIDVSLALKE